MSSTLGSPENPLRVAVVGSGPSGFYAAESLLQSDKKVTVDMFERLPAPYGLVRYGVAPDHPKIKNVIKIYEKIAEKPNFSFLGNVTVGRDIGVQELRNFYDVILLTYGAASDRKLGIPGEDLPGSYTATEFVAWYNGHPDYRDRKFDLSGKVAVVIGQGNVAADVCRILCKTPDELKNTDIAQHALEALQQSKIGEVHMVGRRGPAQAGGFDLGFILGPRLNAAGRLADMGLGIECLITDDEARAANCAQQLDRLNRERRKIEAGMLEQAVHAMDSVSSQHGSVFFMKDWHEGVVGILASRLKDRLQRPVVCFARSQDGVSLKGSGRSVQGFHLRDCLDLVSKRAPGLIARFGGHAAAAGLTIAESDYERFAELFERTADELLPAEARLHVVETDGSLEASHRTLQVAQMLEREIWGQGFPQPVFCDTFAVESQRVVGDKHLKLKLAKDGRRIEAMRFGSTDPLPPRVRAAYRLAVNEFNGLKTVQLNVEHFE